MLKSKAEQLKAWQVARDAGGDAGKFPLYKGYATEVKAGKAADRTVDFTISTAGVDRDNDTIAVDGWKLDNYKRNPVVLWAHDSWSPPIGKALATVAGGDALRSTAQFLTADISPFADSIYMMLCGGFLNATSVGFQPIKWMFNEERGSGGFYAPCDFKEQELLEYSVVPIPSNADALQGAKAAGIDLSHIKAWAEHALDTWSDEKGVWLPKSAVEGALLSLKTGRTFSMGAKAMTKDEFDALSGAEKIAIYYEEYGKSTDKAKWSAAYIDSLEDNCFAAVDSDGRHYPHHPKGEGSSGTGGTVDEPHLKAALSRLGDPTNTQAGKGHIEAHAKKLGIGDDEDDGKALLMALRKELSNNHEPFSGTHTHAHDAYGSDGAQDGDSHSHEHTHKNDNDHHPDSGHVHPDEGDEGGEGKALIAGAIVRFIEDHPDHPIVRRALAAYSERKGTASNVLTKGMQQHLKQAMTRADMSMGHGVCDTHAGYLKSIKGHLTTVLEAVGANGGGAGGGNEPPDNDAGTGGMSDNLNNPNDGTDPDNDSDGDANLARKPKGLYIEIEDEDFDIERIKNVAARAAQEALTAVTGRLPD